MTQWILMLWFSGLVQPIGFDSYQACVNAGTSFQKVYDPYMQDRVRFLCVER